MFPEKKKSVTPCNLKVLGFLEILEYQTSSEKNSRFQWERGFFFLEKHLKIPLTDILDFRQWSNYCTTMKTFTR